MSNAKYSRIDEIPVGSKVIFGRNKFSDMFQDGEEEITWVVLSKDHAMLDSGYPENGVTMIADKVIRYMSFDAKEPANTLPARQTSGNNRWRTSNIRQWLNSDGFANQWYVPQNIGVSGTDNKDTPPTPEYMLNIARNYPYANKNGFMTFFTQAEREALLSAKVTTMIPTVSEGGESLGSFEQTTDYFYLPSITELTGVANGDTTVDRGSVNEGKLIKQLQNSQSTRATELGLINGANFGLNAETEKAYFYRSPAQVGNDIRRYSSSGSDSKSVNIKAFNNDGIRPMTNIKKGSIVMKESNGVYRFVDNANPYVVIDGSTDFNLTFSIYEYDDTLESAKLLLNNEQINVFSVRGKKETTIAVTLPYEKLYVGKNSIKIIAVDSHGNEGVKTLEVLMEKRNVPMSGDMVSTSQGVMAVQRAEVGSNGILTIELDRNLSRTIKKDDIVEIASGFMQPLMAINDDYSGLPIYQEMELDSVDYNKKDMLAIEQWSLVGLGRFSHTKIKMSRNNEHITSYLSRISQIYTYYDEN